MKQEVLFLLLNEYADWEGAFLAISLNTGVIPGSEVKYIPKVVAPTLDVVRSVGGFRTLPDYSFQTMPADYAALVLVGGMHWQSPEAEQGGANCAGCITAWQDSWSYLQCFCLYGSAWFPE